MTIPVPQALYVLMIVLPPLTLILSIPLILGWIRPNPWYGIRTRKTRSSAEIWYRANRLGGIYLTMATLAALLLWGLLALIHLGDFLRVLLDLFILGACVLWASAATLARVAKM